MAPRLDEKPKKCLNRGVRSRHCASNGDVGGLESIERLSLSSPPRPTDAIVHATDAQAIGRQAFLGLVPWPTSLAFPWVLAARWVSVLALACGDATGVLGLAALAAGVLLVAPLAPLAPFVLAVAVTAGVAVDVAADVAAADAGVLGAAAVVVLLDLAPAWPGVGALFAVLVAATVGVGVVVAPVLGVLVVAANPRPANVDRVNAVMMSLFMLSP